MSKQARDITEIAQKQRHLFLLQKIKENKVLTNIEIRELEGYEKKPDAPILPIIKTSPAKRAPKKKAVPAKDKRGQAPRTNRKRLPLPGLIVRRLGFECESLAEADCIIRKERPRLRKTLAKYLKKYPELCEAWERGQLLRNIKSCAAAIMTVTQSAKLLGFARGAELRELLDTDIEICDLWEQTRIQAIVAAKKALAESAKAGNQQAIKAIESFLYDEGEGRAANVNYSQLTINQTADLFGVTRQTVYDWYTKHGLVRNAEGGINLKSTIEWYGNFIKHKGNGKLLPADKLRDLKAEEKKIDLAERRHQLLSREEVIAGLLERWQNVVGAFRYKARELATMVHGQTVDGSEDILSRFFEDLQREWLTVPEFLYLDPAGAEKFDELMEILKGGE